MDLFSRLDCLYLFKEGGFFGWHSCTIVSERKSNCASSGKHNYALRNELHNHLCNNLAWTIWHALFGRIPFHTLLIHLLLWSNVQAKMNVLADYSRSKNQWRFNAEEIAKSPSVRQGLTPAQEAWTRVRGSMFITRCGTTLQLPPETIQVAKVFLNRFYMRNSIKTYNYHDISPACLFIAIKLSDTYRKLRDVIQVCAKKAAKNDNLDVSEGSKDFLVWKNNILFFEEIVLEALCFDLDIELPHPIALHLLKEWNAPKEMAKSVYNYCHDAMSTTIPLQHSTRTIAAAAIYAADKDQEKSCLKPNWWMDLGVSESSLKYLSKHIKVSQDEKAYRQFIDQQYTKK